MRPTILALAIISSTLVSACKAETFEDCLAEGVKQHRARMASMIKKLTADDNFLSTAVAAAMAKTLAETSDETLRANLAKELGSLEACRLFVQKGKAS